MKLQHKLGQLALFSSALLVTIPMINQLVPAAQAAPVTAKSADAFVDIIGVNIHLAYTESAYGKYNEIIKPKLLELGIRHVRDGGYQDPTFMNQIKELGNLGIKSTLIFAGNPTADVISMAKTLQGAIEAIEGPNESDLAVNNYSYQGQQFPEGTRNYQNNLYAAIKGDADTRYLPVVLPSLGWGENSPQLGYLESGDIGNMHSYPNLGNPPTDGLDSYFIPYAQTVAGKNKPLWVTETSYHNLIADDLGISEEAASKYLPRLLLENFNRDIKRVYLYELIDEYPDTEGDVQQHYGLLRRDGSSKPAYTAIKNLISLLKEPGAKFSPGSLDYTLSGDTGQVHTTLLQKSSGEFYLIVWQEVKSWDNENKKDIGIAKREINLNLNTAISQAKIYDPKNSTSPILTPSSSGDRLNQLTIAVPDHPLVIELIPAKG